jgi:hypothetical protein
MLLKKHFGLLGRSTYINMNNILNTIIIYILNYTVAIYELQ